jgi:hypothetical protein
LSGYYARRGDFARGSDMLQQWLKRRPDDQQAKSQLEQLKIMAQADSMAKTTRPVNSPDTTSKK